ncbi:MAG: ferrous iron transport protein A [Gemmataceae bacterium]
MTRELLPLDLVAANEWADVADVCGDQAWVGRMAELGIRTGSRVRVLRPGQPCLVQIGPVSYCVRGNCDCQIWVRPVAEAGAS